MARPGGIGDMAPWRRRSLTIPPASPGDWTHLAIWEIWMGMLLWGFLTAGLTLVLTAPQRIITAADFSGCYATPPLVRPCGIVYRTGAMNAAFSALFGVVCIVIAAWLVWELWSAVAPRPITDDFLKLLNDSFARKWRDPRTWPWKRMFYAYAFAAVGGLIAAAAGMQVSRTLAAHRPLKPPVIKVNTVEDFRVGQ